MKQNLSKKGKTGWEITDLMDSLQNDQSKLVDYSKSYSLSAINPSKDRFVLIRKFAARKYEGKIDMLSSPDYEGGEHYPISQYGMTLVSVTNSVASSHHVILPNSLKYKSLDLVGETITIHHSQGITTTNFKEINKLWTLEKFEEKEILNRFNSLNNFLKEAKEIEKHTESPINDAFFGLLKLNKELDCYEVYKDGMLFSFANTSLDQLTKNLRKIEKLIPTLDKIEHRMVQDMLALKNENWLEDGDSEVSKDEFQKEIKIYGINTYKNGSTEVYYKANNLFWGHEILTRLDNDQNYKSSSIVG